MLPSIRPLFRHQALRSTIFSRPFTSAKVDQVVSTNEADPSTKDEVLHILDEFNTSECSRRTTRIIRKAATAARVAQRQAKGLQSGTTYHPDELGQPRTRQQRPRPVKPSQDPFEVLGLDPLKEYKNFTLLSHFVSDIGKILPRESTGVSAKNQRKLAKAIKRARAMGLMSSTSKSSASTAFFGV
ncbi:hypothetical protein NQZ79_g3426 [Umbelopsis isabellina]|nr:hypothetical protein NQZ79_g3426 [Umbelopsis isabellina]